MNFKFGADPELFVQKEGTFVSGHGLIQGNKTNPYPVERGAVQVDGMALEFNIDPAMTEDDFVFNLESVMDQLKAMVPEYNLIATPVADFDPAYLESQPAEAKELGCDPDFNAWTGEQNQVPDAKASFRTGSGHIHVGWTEDQSVQDPIHISMAQSLVKQMDFYLALPSLLFDADTKRRELYGKAGAHRVKPYGVEYRVLSNMWLGSKDLMRWAFRASQKAVTDLSQGRILEQIYGDIQQIINTSDVKRSREIIADAGLEVPHVR